MRAILFTLATLALAACHAPTDTVMKPSDGLHTATPQIGTAISVDLTEPEDSGNSAAPRKARSDTGETSSVGPISGTSKTSRQVSKTSSVGPVSGTSKASSKARKGNASANNGKGGNYAKTGHSDNGKGKGKGRK